MILVELKERVGTLLDELSSDSKKDDVTGIPGLTLEGEWPRILRFWCLHSWTQ